MKYQSDILANKQLVRQSFFGDDGEIREPDNLLIKAGQEAVDEIVRMSRDLLLKRQVLTYANEKVMDLAAWKTWVTPMEWQSFLLHLSDNKVPVRDITAMKQAIDAQFQVFMTDILEEQQRDPAKWVDIDGVKSFTAQRDKSGGLRLQIELL